MESIEKLSAHLETRGNELGRLKGQGYRIVGYPPGAYMPEELIYACGAVPVQLNRGGDPEAVAASAGYVPRFLDTFHRAQIAYKSSGKEPLYDLPDLLVMPVAENNIRGMADCWNFYTDVEVFRYGIPHGKAQAQIDYYLESLHLLKKRLEQLTGAKIEEDDLRESIKVSNRIRDLFREISLMRKSEPPPIGIRDFVWLNHASFYADREVMLEILASLVEELKAKETLRSTGPRLLLTGSTLAMGDSKVLDLVEATGAQVVIEHFDEGLRHYWENVATEGDPMEALADRYFRRQIVGAWFRPSRERLDFLLKIAREFHVDGVLWYQLMYREGVDIHSYRFSRILKREFDIPMLKLQSDWDTAGEQEPFRTRIEAFVETMKRRE